MKKILLSAALLVTGFSYGQSDYPMTPTKLWYEKNIEVSYDRIIKLDKEIKLLSDDIINDSTKLVIAELTLLDADSILISEYLSVKMDAKNYKKYISQHIQVLKQRQNNLKIDRQSEFRKYNMLKQYYTERYKK